MNKFFGLDNCFPKSWQSHGIQRVDWLTLLTTQLDCQLFLEGFLLLLWIYFPHVIWHSPANLKASHRSAEEGFLHTRLQTESADEKISLKHTSRISAQQRCEKYEAVLERNASNCRYFHMLIKWSIGSHSTHSAKGASGALHLTVRSRDPSVIRCKYQTWENLWQNQNICNIATSDQVRPAHSCICKSQRRLNLLHVRQNDNQNAEHCSRITEQNSSFNTWFNEGR